MPAEAKLEFKAHRHVLRHACGFALASKAHDTRALQAYLGHKNIRTRSGILPHPVQELLAGLIPLRSILSCSGRGKEISIWAPLLIARTTTAMGQWLNANGLADIFAASKSGRVVRSTDNKNGRPLGADSEVTNFECAALRIGG